MNILVLNRYTAEDICAKAEAKHIVISIYSTDGTPAIIKPNKNRLSLLYTAFDDVEEKEILYGNYVCTPITENQAKKIWEFVKEYKDKVSLIIVHCDGGICRSPAVAQAIGEYLSIEENLLFFNKEIFIPNKKVYQIMKETQPIE